ncbi:MAG: PKD domain-containing protein [Vicinamibacterales bacterium]
MIPCSSRLLLAVLGCLGLVASACEKAPLLAPSGSSITLTTATNTLSANGSATIVAQVLEAAGTPPHSGTRVTFMTTLGTIDPAEASTDANGRATVTFRSNGANGVAEISAASGGATTSGSSSGGTGGDAATSRNLTIWIGTAATGRVVISANPAILPTVGGTTSVVANVLDRNGNALVSAPVTFTTTAGTLSASVVNTDASGNASVLLTTTQAATVTATVGVASSQGGSTSGGTSGGTTNTGNSNLTASVTVPLTSAPVLAITPPGAPPSAGLPAAFTFRVTPASSTGSSNGGSSGGTTTGTIPVRELVVQWGDGTTDNLGAVSGEQTVSHVYRSAGNFTLTATVTDVAGGTARVSTAVAVIPVPRPTIIITPTPQSAPSGTLFQFRIEITAPNGLAITNVVIDFGDGTTQALGGASGLIQVLHTYSGTPRSFNVTVTVTDSSGQTTVGSSIVAITGP